MSPNNFHKPSSVTFTFQQKRHDKTGDIVDNHGQIVYRLKDTSDDHTFGFAKSYPLEVYHARNNQFAFTLDWHSAAKKTTVSGLNGRHGELVVNGGLLDDDLKWSMPDGSQFEWDGVYGFAFNLLDYRIQQPYSLTPAVAAIYTPRPSKKEFTQLEVHRDALSVPGFLDYLIATVLWMEYNYYQIVEKQAGAAAGKKLGTQLGKLAHNMDGGGDGGGGDGGGGG